MEKAIAFLITVDSTLPSLQQYFRYFFFLHFTEYAPMNHRIIDSRELEKALKTLLPWAGMLSTRPDYPKPINLALNNSRNGAIVASLSNMFQCITTLIVKNLFLIHNQNALSFNLKPLAHEYGLTCVI